MLRGSLIPKLAGGVLAAALVSSGLAYAGVEGAPNPVELVVNAATRGGDDVQTQDEDVPEVADANKAEAEANAEAAEAYANAVREWTACVAQVARTHSETATTHSETATSVPPKDACGPHPAKQGLQPGQQKKADHGGATGAEADDGSNDDTGKPDDVPRGNAEGHPSGAPEDATGGAGGAGPGDTPAGYRP
jgi:hypothetical protein